MLMGAMALFPLFLAARARVESSATALILEDVLVAPFVTYSWVILFLEPKANLFRAPVLVWQPFDKVPGFPWNAGAHYFGQLALRGQLMCLAWAGNPYYHDYDAAPE